MKRGDDNMWLFLVVEICQDYHFVVLPFCHFVFALSPNIMCHETPFFFLAREFSLGQN